MTMRFRSRLILLLGFLLMAACNNEGLAAFSPGNDRVAIITNQQHLYTTNVNGGDTKKIDNDAILTGFDVSFNQVGNKILYVNSQSKKICQTNSTGGGLECPVQLPDVVGGFLSYLPNGQFIVAYKSGDTWVMQIYNPGGGAPTVNQGAINHFFLTADAFKVKRNTGGKEWYLRPYNKPTGLQILNIVYTIGANVYRIQVGGGLDGPTQIGTINAAVQNALQDREQEDITSGVISPDGTKLVFRTKTGTDPNFVYGLYAVDLAVPNSQPIQLVSNANFRIEFAFSPNGAELVFESNQGGRSVWVANANGTSARKLADNASMPNWHANQ